MAITGQFNFRRTFWGKIVLQVEEERASRWPWSWGKLKRVYRDATVMDLTKAELRPLIDLRNKSALAHSPLHFAQPFSGPGRAADEVGIAAAADRSQLRISAH